MTGTIRTKKQSIIPRNIQEEYRLISLINIDTKTLNKLQASLNNLLKINMSLTRKVYPKYKMVQPQKIYYLYTIVTSKGEK